MLLIFFIGVGELLVRWLTARRELALLKQHYLPQDDATVLQAHDLGSIRRAVAKQFDGEHGFPPLAHRPVHPSVSVHALGGPGGKRAQQQPRTHSPSCRSALLNAPLHLVGHSHFRLYGNRDRDRAGRLDRVDPDALDLKKLTTALAVAFNTTLIALVLSAILVFLLHITRGAVISAVPAPRGSLRGRALPFFATRAWPASSRSP